MNKITVTILGVLVVVVIGYILFRGNNQVQLQTSLEVPAPGNEGIEETVIVPGESDESSEVQSGAREISIASRSYIYDPEFIEVERGEVVTINFQNSGIHTFTIDELGINESLRGSSVTVEFTPDEIGTFEFYCSIPGHKERGMMGELIVN